MTISARWTGSGCGAGQLFYGVAQRSVPHIIEAVRCVDALERWEDHLADQLSIGGDNLDDAHDIVCERSGAASLIELMSILGDNSACVPVHQLAAA